MKKLDNGGWGFIMFIIFIFLFLLAILTVAYTVNDFERGLSDSKSDSLVSKYETYRKYENIIERTANKYSQEFPECININDLNINTAIKNECTGYASINIDKESYSAYLKCGNYETVGFSNKC